MLGEMERSYLAYLLTFDPSLTALGGRQKISVVHVGWNGCPNPFMTLSPHSLLMAVS